MKTLKLKKKNIITNKTTVYDIEVNNAHHYILKNGIISHNCVGAYVPTNIQSGGCLVPTEEIITTNGEKQIKDVNIGDFVLSHDGKFHEVKQTWQFKKPTYIFEYENGETLECSNTHRFLINLERPELETSWKTADELNDGDEIYTLV